LVSPTAALTAQNIFSSTAQFDATNTTHPNFSNSDLTFIFDPDTNLSPPPGEIQNGEKVTYDYANASQRYNSFEEVTVEVTVTDPNGNTDKATDTCSVGNL
jgi:hypothetical protein